MEFFKLKIRRLNAVFLIKGEKDGRKERKDDRNVVRSDFEHK